MTSENDFKRSIAMLLTKYVSLTTEDIKKKIGEVVVLDKQDLEMSKTRNEPMYKQRIGNIVSHMKSNVVNIYNYQIKKGNGGKIPTTFTLLTSKDDDIKPVPQSDIKDKKVENSFKPIKINWNKKISNNNNIGRRGELFVLDEELNKQTSPSDKIRIEHTSQYIGDGTGYDIMSVDSNGNTLYIEVKTTTMGEDTPFYMSHNEKEFFEQNINSKNLLLYRVYDFDLEKDEGKIKKISPKELFEHVFKPMSYKVL
ncbi:DUF3883 domain-containing protein [Apilactobacillus ozensis]|uniref:DUF3883 domain-containing protein n=1 Tax=Apilactobacillus ozensis TaxID=866801 RepID=UPI00200A9E76|nr:DUF3883 domain-containing protein [Apilactobacillus ozensis]MCK8606981.1 DUF3883 domain-containing protein [Apilactobacillus ozensis]